jgi:hypothetical protein
LIQSFNAVFLGQIKQNMISVNTLVRHRTTLGSFVLLLFFLANAGFTIVVSTCTMGAVGCGCGSGTETCALGCCEVPRDNSPVVTLTSDGDCNATLVIGGLPEHPSIIEKTSAEAQVRPSYAMVPASSPGLEAPHAQCQTPIASVSTTVHTSSVEKYVLNATFLI